MGEELVVMLASTRDTANIKKPIISLYCNNTVIQKPQIAILDWKSVCETHLCHLNM